MLKMFVELKYNHTLIDLNLSNINSMMQNANLTSEVVEEGIYPYLTNKDCVLNFLNLQGCFMGNHAFCIFSKAVIKNTSLLSLNIAHNHLSGI